MFLFIVLTSQLQVAVAEDPMTSQATWQDIITQCKQYQQEQEQEQHRDVTRSIELLSEAVCNLLRLRHSGVSNSTDETKIHTTTTTTTTTTTNNNNNNNNNNAFGEGDDEYSEEYHHILE